MIKFTLKISSAIVAFLVSTSMFAQTSGNLTFTYTPTSHTGFSGTRNVLAVWIQTSTGAFVKTKIRNAGGGTSDHLPTWAVNSGGTAGNCMAAACNVVSATTGATLQNFSLKTITWDGTDASGNIVADGTYKVTIQSTWDHGSAGTVTRSFTFTKGPSSDIQSPTADANFTGISLQWIPSAASIDENSSELTKVYPNPSSNGKINVEYSSANTIKVVNILGVTVYEVKLETESGSKEIDLSAFNEGIYFIYVTDGNKSTKHKVILN